MSVWAHFKDLYLGEYPEDVYRFRNIPSLPKDVEQAVNLEKSAHQFAFKSEEYSIIQKLNTLIDLKAHQELIGYKTDHLLKKGFKPLSLGQDMTVWEHRELQGWLIKANSSSYKHTWVDGDGGRCRFSKYNSLHRVFLAQRMQEEIAKNHWNLVIPEKRLFRSPHAKSTDSLHKKYYVLSKKINILSVEESCKAIGQQPASVQRRIAIQICDLIKRTGFTDANETNITALKNFSLQSKFNLAIIDTEPLGLIKEASEPDGYSSFKCCVLTGLSKFAESFGSKFSTFAEEIRWAQEELVPEGEIKVSRQRETALKEARLWFIVKIIVSILCPLIPLALLCEAATRSFSGGVARIHTFNHTYLFNKQPNLYIPLPFVPPPSPQPIWI